MNTNELAEAIAQIPFGLLDSMRQLRPRQFLAPTLSEGRSLRDVLAHMLEAEQVWVGHIILKSEKAPIHPEDFTSVDDLARAWRPVRQQTVQFLQKATREQLAEVIVDEYDSHITYSVELALWHFVTHEFYHAGEICLHLGLNGLQPFVPEIIR